jgi:hypothetical protein
MNPSIPRPRRSRSSRWKSEATPWGKAGEGKATRTLFAAVVREIPGTAARSCRFDRFTSRPCLGDCASWLGPTGATGQAKTGR